MPQSHEHIAVVTDSTCNIPPSMAEARDIEVVNATIAFGDEFLIDVVDITPEEFLVRLQKPGELHPTTSSPGPGPFMEAYGKYPGRIFSIHVAGGLSGFLQHSVLAADNLGRKNITPYDSMSTSLGLGFMVMEAKRLAQEGYPESDILNILDDQRKRTYVAALADTLKYLHKSGRINMIEEGLGSLLDLKPMLLIKDSKVTKIGVARTRKQAVPTFIEWVRRHAPFEKIGVVYAGNEDLAREIAYALRADVDSEEIIITPITPALSVHIGPGAIGICFVEKRRQRVKVLRAITEHDLRPKRAFAIG